MNIRHGLPGAAETIHRPGGLLRHLLREAPPVAPDDSAPRQRPRVRSMRECAGDRHVQPLLFSPVADERLCRDCRLERAEGDARRTAGVSLTAARGLAAARSALRGGASGRLDVQAYPDRLPGAELMVPLRVRPRNR